jgi:two-component system chemotaxis sensor kinase CheA
MSTELLDQFISESRDLLDGASGMLLELERSPNDAALVNEVFRMVHTMKGNSGLFEFPEMTKVLHAGEDLLDAVRDGRVAYSHDIADKLLEAIDFVVILTDEIESTKGISAKYQKISVQLASELKALNVASASGVAKVESSEVAEANLPNNPLTHVDWKVLEDVPLAVREKLASALEAGNLTYLQYTPEADCFFKGEDPFYQARQTPDVVWSTMHYHEVQVDDELLWDPYRCNMVFTVLSTADIEKLFDHFRYVVEQVKIEPVPANVWSGNQTKVAQKNDAVMQDLDFSKLTAEDQTYVNQILQTQIEVLNQPIETVCFAGVIQAVTAALSGVLLYSKNHQFNASLQQACEQSLKSMTVNALLDWCNQHSGNQAKQQSIISTQSTQEVIAAVATVAETGVDAKDDEAKFGRRSDDAPAAKTLKVDQDKIDRLMNLIGEMVVAKNSLPYLAAKAENQFGVRELAREIKGQYSVINRIAEEMQQSIMQIRMMPVSFIFQRFPRLVRDTCRKLGKEVNLILEGESTEADKLIVEALAEPLIHIVRNSLDHGIEMPEARKAKGKPLTGTLTIRASQQSDSVLIEIIDDGKGINPDIIKRKAVEKGLISEATMERMSDQEAVNLVFAPGFSTAEAITDLSGRGVGMDAVRSAIERVNGKVSLHSKVDQGTTIRLTLPLSMAVTNIMVVESNRQKFGVPMDMVLETVRIPQTAIRTIKQSKTTVLRGRIVPLVSLNTLLNLDEPHILNEDGEVALLIVRINDEYVGMMVDEFKATVDIILKPLPGVLADMKWYAGSALMGDGSVLMVLNPKELI